MWGSCGAPHPRGPPGDGGDPEWPRHSHGGRRGTPAAGRTPPGTAADDPVGGERGDQMSVYITGDTHGGFQRFGSKYFPQQKNMGREDYVIVTGDFGGLWDGSPKDQYWLDWLEEKPFTTLFVDGNHENFDLLNALPGKAVERRTCSCGAGACPSSNAGAGRHLRRSDLVHHGRRVLPRYPGRHPGPSRSGL